MCPGPHPLWPPSHCPRTLPPLIQQEVSWGNVHLLYSCLFIVDWFTSANLQPGLQCYWLTPLIGKLHAKCHVRMNFNHTLGYLDVVCLSHVPFTEDMACLVDAACFPHPTKHILNRCHRICQHDLLPHSFDHCNWLCKSAAPAKGR